MKNVSDNINTRSYKVPSKGSKISHYNTGYAGEDSGFWPGII